MRVCVLLCVSVYAWGVCEGVCINMPLCICVESVWGRCVYINMPVCICMESVCGGCVY